jgi:hypothetical protein
MVEPAGQSFTCLMQWCVLFHVIYVAWLPDLAFRPYPITVEFAFTFFHVSSLDAVLFCGWKRSGFYFMRVKAFRFAVGFSYCHLLVQVTWLVLHFYKGSAFYQQRQELNKLTLWEQIDEEHAWTPTKKLLTVVPIALYAVLFIVASYPSSHHLFV